MRLPALCNLEGNQWVRLLYTMFLVGLQCLYFQFLWRSLGSCSLNQRQITSDLVYSRLYFSLSVIVCPPAPWSVRGVKCEKDRSMFVQLYCLCWPWSVSPKLSVYRLTHRMCCQGHSPNTLSLCVCVCVLCVNLDMCTPHTYTEHKHQLSFRFFPLNTFFF